MKDFKTIKVGITTIAFIIISGITFNLFGSLSLKNDVNVNANNTTLNDSVLVNGNSNSIINNYNNTPDPSNYNPRSESTMNLSKTELVEHFFSLYNSYNFTESCSLLQKSKCDSTNGESKTAFSRERFKTLDGYEMVNVYESSLREDIVCAKYKYKYKADYNPKYIHNIIALYIVPREDGPLEIGSRVCEKNFKEGIGDRPCPNPASELYCI